MELCDGCGFLRFEDRPHGVKAARCGSRAPTGCAIRGYGRTLEVFSPAAQAGARADEGIGPYGMVLRPKWCRGERKRIATPVTSVTGSQ